MFSGHISLLCLATTVLATPARLASGLHHRRHVSHESSPFARLFADVLPRDDCEPADPQNTVTDRLNTLLNSSGPGYTLPLCAGESYYITAPLQFAAHDQEISTCADCDNINYINGTRGTNGPTNGGANIEMGGDNSGQLIEFVHSSTLGAGRACTLLRGPSNATIRLYRTTTWALRTDAFQQWADGISISCMNTVVRNNMVKNPTDGGIVIFGAPGTLSSPEHAPGGINMVDYDPWAGNYTGTVVRNNLIMGGFATSEEEPGETHGVNSEDVIIKIGIAIGPLYQNVSFSGTVLNNQLTGAFGYAMAISSARNFTVQGNLLTGNTSFIGGRGPNCTEGDTVPNPTAFVIDPSLRRRRPHVYPAPAEGDYWPFGGNPSNPGAASSNSSSSPTSSTSSSSGGLSGGGKAGIAIGVILAVAAIAVATYVIRRWALARARAGGADPWRRSGYLGKGKEAYERKVSTYAYS
ncbi:uncharacterized protein B0H18DRAFT_965550 [Fomitopsis serialis]|uniref:uncharacterized protein n=1 Tax=Fomitopsis serialis TaxID=139415 RepID=UPI002008266C|nr:uncharacterized protein B0H18DRAFT_965550 [Neoantrodia serialis]KAH9938100.1 hypothetical protein B0H18DRAFT_965550 [Neoantrodia serialis]